MEYNTERSQLIIPEYGRHIQKLIDHALTLENKEERNKMANGIITVMGNLNPHLRDVPDFKHKLWDQLFIMSKFQLDVDSPFPKPTPEKFSEPPQKLEYPTPSSKYRFYGKNILKMIEEAKKWKEGEKREGLVFSIANHMKKCFLLWNKDTVDDRVIFNHLKELSGGIFDYTNSNESLRFNLEDHSMKPNKTNHKKKKKYNKKR